MYSSEPDPNQTWDVLIYSGKNCDSSLNVGRLGDWWDYKPWKSSDAPQCLSFYPYAGNSPYKTGSLSTFQGQVWDNVDHFPGKWGLKVFLSQDCGSAKADKPVLTVPKLASKYSNAQDCFNVPEGQTWGSALLYANF